MRIQQVDITEVFFQTKEYTQGMYDSIVRIGLSFPVKVSLEQGKFYCQDGHKRLSAIAPATIEKSADLEMDGRVDLQNLLCL